MIFHFNESAKNVFTSLKSIPIYHTVKENKNILDKTSYCFHGSLLSIFSFTVFGYNSMEFTPPNVTMIQYGTFYLNTGF